MRKTIHILLILSFLVGTYATTSAQSYLEKKGFKGKIKSISSTVHRTAMKDGKIELLSVSQLGKRTFNEAGYMTVKEYQFNTLSMGEGPKRKTVYVYNKDNEATKETSYKDETKGRYSEYIHKDGQLVEAKYYKEDGTLMGTQYMSYDDNGNKLLSKATDVEGNPIQVVELTYTKDNKVASAKENKRGKFVRYAKYEYPNEKEEKVISMDTKAADETIKSYTVNTYDDNKNVISAVQYTADGTLEKKTIYKYNEQGDQTLREISDADGVIEDYNYVRYEYKYDEKGNWIEKTEYLKNGNSLDLEKRVIEYYK